MPTPPFTLATVAFNAVDAVALMWESFLHYHPRASARLVACDNASTDGAEVYLRRHADHYVRNDLNYGHGTPLNNLCDYVLETPTRYLIVIDTDVEFRETVCDRIAELLEKPGVGCVCYPSAKGRADLGRCWHFGDRLSLPRIDPCFAAFRTDVFGDLFRRSKPVGWHPHDAKEVGLFFDAGAAIRYVLERQGYEVEQPAWLGAAVKHYGGLSSYYCEKALSPEDAKRFHQNDPSVQAAREHRMAVVRARLAAVRGGRP